MKRWEPEDWVMFVFVAGFAMFVAAIGIGLGVSIALGRSI